MSTASEGNLAESGSAVEPPCSINVSRCVHDEAFAIVNVGTPSRFGPEHIARTIIFGEEYVLTSAGGQSDPVKDGAAIECACHITAARRVHCNVAPTIAAKT